MASYPLAPLLYANLFPDIPFPRVVQLKQIAETVGSLCPNPGRYSETRTQAMNRGYLLHTELQSLLSHGTISEAEIKVLYRFMNEETSLSISEKGFAASLWGLANDDQRKNWGEVVRKKGIVGCFALNEVGNGGDFDRIETTAEFDVETQEFVLCTNTPAAVKWLIGALGKSATHALIFARTFLSDSTDIGVHGFLTPVRDPVTLDPFPGIEIGDTGPKFGANFIDNGYLRLTNVRVPRTSMLAGLGTVTIEGRFVQNKEANRKPMIVGKVAVRMGIVTQAWYHLARAITISLRYSSIRKQFRTYPTEPTKERPVIDYQFQSFRLIPVLAQVYAMSVGSGMLMKLVKRDLMEATSPEGDRVALLYGLSAGLKAVYSHTAAEQSELCRQSCGGHGFSCYSGLPSSYRDFLAQLSLGGDSVPLLMEAAQFLVSVSAPGNTAFPGPFQYLRDAAGQGGGVEGSLSRPQAQSQAFQACVRLQVGRLRERVEGLIKRGEKLGRVWGRLIQVEAGRAVEMAVWEVTNREMEEVVGRAGAQREILESLRNLFALWTLYTHRNLLLRYRLITSLQSEDLYNILLEAIGAVKLHREVLVDSFMLSDSELNSALGRKDGKVYETLLHWVADQNPMNNGQVFEGVRFLRGKL